MSEKLNIDMESGLSFRPRTEFANEVDYFKQFLCLARPKLTKKLFFQLPAGLYLTPNGSGFENMEIAPESERAAQWKSIYPGARQRLCEVYRNKAHYEAMLAEGRKAQEIAKSKGKVAGTNENTKPSPQLKLDGKAAFDVFSRSVNFASQPVADSVQAVVLVFKIKRGVPETDYALEVAKIALESIKVFEMTGKVEFLAGYTVDKDYVFCAGFEPFESHPRAALIFNARMKKEMPKLAYKTGLVKLNKAQCSTEELKLLRAKYVNQGYYVFVKGKLSINRPGGNSWIAKALGLQFSTPKLVQ